MKRILFVTAPYHCWGVQVVGTWPPLHLVYMAGAAEQVGAEARIFDAMNKDLGFDEIRAEIERFRPHYVVAIDYLPVTGAIATATVPDVIRILNLAKEVDPEIVTITGGPHPSFMYEEMLGDPDTLIDIVVRGEPEATLAAVIAADARNLESISGLAFRAGGEIVATADQPHIQALDDLKPAWHLLDWEDYHYNVEPKGRMTSILGSRGCDMGCAFCAQRMFWKKDWRSRSPQDVVDEIVHLKETYQVDYFTLIDAYPTKMRRRWEEFLDLLIERDLGVQLLIETRVEDIIRDRGILHKYREAGIMHVYVGAESGDEDQLAALNKGTTVEKNKQAIDLLREADIMSEASFMIGFVTETWESVQRTIDAALHLNPDVAVFPVVTPMPFTPIFEEMKHRIRVWDYSQYNLVTPIVEPEAMSLEEVTKALGQCYMKFYKQKGKEIFALPDGFKRRYMMSALKLMMEAHGSSFDFHGSGMTMPHPMPK